MAEVLGSTGAWTRLRGRYASAADDRARLDALLVYTCEAGPYLAKRWSAFPLLAMGAEDAASEACVRVMRGFHTLQPVADAGRAALMHSGWVYVVLRNVVLDWQRRASARLDGRSVRLDLTDGDPWVDGGYGDSIADLRVVDDPLERVAGGLDAACLLRELAGPAYARDAALLADATLGDGYAEAARSRGMRGSTFRVQVLRARRRLARVPAVVAWRGTYG